MAVITAIVAGVVVAGAAVYSAVERKNAADKAADAQKDAVKRQNKLLEQLDPGALNNLAKKFDAERAVNRLALQKEIDPEVAQLRELSKKALLDSAQQPKDSQQSQQLATKLFNETKEQDPRLIALKDSILSNAQREIDAGASLPPEFQGELVRAGLEQGGQSGIGYDKSAIGGGVARMLGAAGIQLQQQRQQQAIELTRAAEELQNTRVNILATVFPKLRDLEISQRNEASANLALANSMIPEAGMSGADAVNAQIAKVKGKAGLVQQTGQIKANQAIAEGEQNAQIAQGIASGVTTAAGGVGGMGGMGGGGGGGGGGPTYAPVGSYVNANPTGNFAQQGQMNYLSSYQAPSTGSYSGYGIRY